MSEETLRSYRLTSLEAPTQSPELRWNPLMREEPSDEMLHAKQYTTDVPEWAQALVGE